MNQLTVRGFDKELARRIRKVAKEQGISLNQAAVLLLRQGAGLRASGKRTGAAMDNLGELIGAWTKQEEAEFLDSIRPMEKVDAKLWK